MDTETATILAQAWDDITKTPGVEEARYDHMGLWSVEYDGCTYAIGTEAEAEAAAVDYIRESLWAFRPEFLADYCHKSITPDHIRRIVGNDCEGANDAVSSLIEDIDELISDAIACDGVGHFLNSYDGEAEEVTSPCGDRLVIVRVD